MTTHSRPNHHVRYAIKSGLIPTLNPIQRPSPPKRLDDSEHRTEPNAETVTLELRSKIVVESLNRPA
jgi:hypothetical protein